MNQGPHLSVEHNVNYDSHDTPLYFVMSADRCRAIFNRTGMYIYLVLKQSRDHHYLIILNIL
jgi:hypothetical protein